MRISIITFHFPHNPGAVLQCMALQNYLKAKGHEVTIIDYRPDQHARMYRPIRNPFTEATDFVKNYGSKNTMRKIYKWVRHFGSVLLSCFSYRVVSEREKFFSSFISKNIKMTRRYDSLEALRADPPAADVYISGSDQVWNSDITNGRLDPAYFLRFGDSKIVRIAYAVSANIKNNEINDYKLFTDKIKYISLREKNTACQLEKLLKRKIAVTVDPTLLLSASDYEGYITRKATYDYILFYGLRTKENNSLIKDTLKKVQKEYNLPIIDISPIDWRISVQETHRVISPNEFLSYIYGASVVITNSFHGSVFSITFKREIWCVLPSLSGTRISDLFESVGLRDRIIKKLEDTETIKLNAQIDYDLVSSKVERNVIDSKEYLDRVLRG